jgi:hypothetical protein
MGRRGTPGSAQQAAGRFKVSISCARSASRRTAYFVGYNGQQPAKRAIQVSLEAMRSKETQLEFAELVLKRFDERSLKTVDYIDWANEMLESGSSAPSIWQLAVCRWEADADPEQVERLFKSSVSELGLVLPSDWFSALCLYSSEICEKMLQGEIQPWDCMDEMLTIAEEYNEPYLHWIWIDLSRDLDSKEDKPTDYIQFNQTLDVGNSEESIRTVARQFIVLCSMSLPEKFPWVWICQKCDSVSEESTFTEVKTCTCDQCGSVSAMKNMRFFEHRESLINGVW